MRGTSESPVDLRQYLIDSRLAGEVATSPGESRRNCKRLSDGNPDYTFGLSDWRDADLSEIEGAVVDLCGEEALSGDPDGPGHIDPDRALDGIAHHRARLQAHAEDGSRVVLATGHPTGLLAHYIELARALVAAGCDVLTPLDDRWLTEDEGGRTGLRYIGRVGCVWTGGDLVHTHRSHYMEAALDEVDGAGALPDLVIADHGMAGAAVERGIETLSIADVNDPALQLASSRGRTDGVLVIDDNLAPQLFRPVTAAMLEGLGTPAVPGAETDR